MRPIALGIWTLILVGLIALSGCKSQEKDVAYTPRPIDSVELTADEVTTNPVDDQIVTLDGHVVQHLEGDEWLFEDASGQVVIEVGPEMQLELRRPLKIIGRVDSDIGELEVDVLEIHYPDGTVVKLRDF